MAERRKSTGNGNERERERERESSCLLLVELQRGSVGCSIGCATLNLESSDILSGRSGPLALGAGEESGGVHVLLAKGLYLLPEGTDAKNVLVLVLQSCTSREGDRALARIA